MTTPRPGRPARAGSTLELRERRGVGLGSKHEHVMRRSRELRPVEVALAGMWSPDSGFVVSMVDDERASRVVDVDHGACVAEQRSGHWFHDRGMYLSALPSGVGYFH